MTTIMMATVPEMARRKQERKEHMAMLEGGDNSKRWPSLLRRSGSRAGESRSRLVNRKLSMVVHHGCGSRGIGGIHEQQPHGR